MIKSMSQILFLIFLFLLIFKMKWLKILIYPKEVLRKEKFNASNKNTIKIVGIAGLITGIILSSAIIFFPWNNTDTAIGVLSKICDKNILICILPQIILFPLYSIVCVWILSGILYKFAKIFGGKGNFTVQTYMVSLIAAPYIIMYVLFFYICRSDKKIIYLDTLCCNGYLLIISFNFSIKRNTRIYNKKSGIDMGNSSNCFTAARCFYKCHYS